MASRVLRGVALFGAWFAVSGCASDELTGDGPGMRAPVGGSGGGGGTVAGRGGAGAAGTGGRSGAGQGGRAGSAGGTGRAGMTGSSGRGGAGAGGQSGVSCPEQDIYSVNGKACSIEGEVCGDPCDFGLLCANHHWQVIESYLVPGCDDAHGGEGGDGGMGGEAGAAPIAGANDGGASG